MHGHLRNLGWGKYSCIVGFFLFLSFTSHGQTLQNGAAEAKFGGDADTRSNISLFGNAAAPITTTDDWFSNGGQPGIGVIDTTFSWQLSNALQNGTNIEWLGGMAYPQNSIMNGVRLHDASYAKDFYGGAGAIDYTSFIQASKNGEDPAIWDDGPHNVLGKNDLIDCYAHIRRDGISLNNHLWMYLGYSRIATSGDSYFDAELYVEEMSYDPVNGFPSGGPDEGHTAWGFDAVGNIVKVGDLVTTCHFSTSGAPELELRIWVSRYDFQNTNPATFTFGGEFDGGSNSSAFGYADVQIPPNEVYGFGLGNSDYVAAPPWGTLNSSGDFTLFYEANQFVEVGLDLTVFGVDPILLNNAINADICELPFSNILFKSRASNSFTAQLKDFAGPFPFNYTSEIPVSISGLDTIDCYNELIELYVADTIENSFYTWYTEDGNIISDTNTFLILIDQPGTYIVEGTFLENCEGSRDTIVVVDNFIYPQDAEITFETTYGCGVPSHIMANPDGYIYNWSGPNNYTSNLQDVFVTDEGMYYLEVFNVESGCSAYDSIYVLGYPCQGNIPDTIATTEMLDTIPPTFTVPVNVNLDCNDDPIDLLLTGDVTDESDDCDTGIGEAFFLDIVSDNFPCAGTTLIQRHWTLIDFCGNITMHIQTINLVDATPPIFTAPIDITINCEDDINDLMLTGGVTNTSDNCDPGTMMVSFSDQQGSAPCLGEKLINRTWTVSDDCGNTSSAIQVITLIDTIPPVFTVPADITIECDSDPTDLTLVGDVFDETDNCDSNVGQAIYTDVLTADNPCEGAGTITRTWTLTDDCDNVISAIQTITLEDTTPPVLLLVTANQPSVECDTIVPLPELGVDLIITDNCDPDVEITFSESIIGNECPDKFTMRRVWVATDACNNQDSIVQEFQVQDTENPIVIVLPADVTLECNEAIPNGGAVVDDNCSDEINISFAETITPGSCANNYVIERVWTWSDNCGNAESHTQIITIEDTTPPDFTVPADVTLDCSQDPNDLTITGDVTNEIDNCDTGLEATFTDNIIAGFPCDGSSLILRTWLLEDGCGNTFSQVQEITMLDNLAFVFTTPLDVTISCDQNPADLTVTGDVLDESDNCTINLGEATYTDSLATASGCSNTGIIYRRWTLEDGCGNTTSSIQEITIVDNTAPEMTTPTDITLACSDDPADLNLSGEVTNISDNCSSGVLNSFYTDSIEVSILCEQNYTIYRTWRLEDACGNDTAYVQVITIQDIIAPVFTTPADITLECGQDPNDLYVTGDVQSISDNCDSNLGEATYVDNIINAGPCPNATLIERTWTMTDACGNSSSAIQQITIEDTTPPIFSAPSDVTIDCNQDPTDLTLTGDVLDESDGCDAFIGQATYSDISSVVGVCTGSTTIERIWSLTDACGNVTTAIQSILMEDTAPPAFTVPVDITLECDQDPYDLSVTGDVVDESDNCTSNIGQAYYSDSIRIDSATCLQSVVILRTWVLVDGCGNDSMAVQTILVEDTTPPVMTIPEDITLDCGADISDLSLSGEPVSITDICDDNVIIPVYADSIVVGAPCDGATTIYRTWSALDACGNEIAAIQEIILQDTFPPVFVMVPADTIVNCNEDPVANENLSTTDSCGGNVVVAFTETKLEGSCVDSHYLIRTWTATDACGNIATASQQITVINCGPTVELLLGSDTTVCEFETVHFEVQLSGEYDTPNYQWQYSNDSGSNWANIIGANSFNYTIGAAALTDIGLFRCVIANDPSDLGDTICSVQTDEIALMVLPLSAPVQIDAAICQGAEFVMGGVAYAEAGTFMDTIASANGCDSMLQLNLTINPVYGINLIESICEGESYQVGDSIYTEPGTHVTTLPTEAGCDSVITLTLTVNPVYTINLNETICEGEAYEVGDSVYTNSGTYTTTLSSGELCDSIIILTLTVNSVYAIELVESICEGESYQVGDSIYTETGTHTTTLSTQEACDSIVTVTLTVHPQYEESNSAVICDGDTYEFGGSTYTETGDYTFVFASEFGCDSLIHLNLLVQPNQEVFFEAAICEGDAYEFGGEVYTNGGVYTQELIASSGCDSIIHLSLSVNSLYEFETYLSICLGEEVSIAGEMVSSPGTYVESIASHFGCDSILIYHLSVLSPGLAIMELEICDGDSVYAGGEFQNTGGVYVDTLSAASGCDSIVITNLQLVNNIIVYTTIEICEGDSVLIGGVYRSEAGVYADTTQSAATCDSITLTEIILLQAIITEQEFDVCLGEGVWVGGEYLTEPGIYFDTLTMATGCDSVILTSLIIGNAIELNQSLSICEGDSVWIGGFFQSAAGTYADTLQTDSGCDSIMAVHLSLLPSVATNQSFTICSGKSIFAGGANQTEAGVYTDILSNSLGCDSIVTTIIIVNPPIENQIMLSICEGDAVFFGSTFLSVAGTYIDSLSTNQGCDSIVTLDLQVVQILNENFELQICEGDSVLIGGIYESSAGAYEYTYTSSGGCDSIVETVLTVVNNFETTHNEVICQGDSVLFGNDYYSAAGQYVLNLTTSGGCDSIVILNLDVLTAYELEIYETICTGDTYIFDNNVYSSPGVYVFDLVSEGGCDSTLILNLEMYPVTETMELIQICQGDSVFVGGSYQLTAGIYIDVLQNQYACDSVHTTEIIVRPDYVEEHIVQICQGGGVWVNGVYETEAGVYINNLSTIYGCDSIEVVNLNVVDELIGYQAFELCEGDGVAAGGAYQTDSGIYYDTLTSVNGCDSIIITELDLQTIFASVEEWNICNGDSILLGDIYIKEAGVFNDTLTTEAGCDSIVFVSLELLPAYYFTMSEHICAGDSLIFGNTVYKEEGVYTNTLSSYTGCDSIISIELEVYPKDSLDFSATICAGEMYEFAGNVYTESGIYIADLQTALGCDSIVRLELTVLDLLTDTIAYSICEGEFFVFEGQVLSSAGTYEHEYTGVGGCDSLLVVELEVGHSSEYSYSDTICNGSEYLFAGNILTEPGIYTNTLSGSNTCDSIVTFTLAVLDALVNEMEVHICLGDSLWLNGGFQTEEGMYTDTYTSVMGCDSIVTTELKLMLPVESNEQHLMCEGDSLFIMGAYYHSDTLLEMNYSSYQGCDSIVKMELLIIPLTDLLVEDFEICDGETVQLDVYGATDVSWTPADGLSCTDCPNPEASPSYTTTYTVSAESCLGAIVEAEVTVIVNYPPMIVLTSVDDESVVLGDSVLIFASVSDPNATVTWTDSEGETYCTGCESIMVEPYYGVSYIATAVTMEGCVDKAELKFSINDSCAEGVLDVPNFVTPNGDGHNDKFEIRYSNFSEMSILRIYNRWGELVFQTENIDSDFWDGTFRGKTLNPDVYIYYLKAKCLNGNPFMYKGNITIIK